MLDSLVPGEGLKMGDINRSGGKFPRHATTLSSKYVVPHISVMPKRHILSWYRLQDPATAHVAFESPFTQHHKEGG